jgi:hypothetical protein
MSVETCPVCEGRGVVHRDFYDKLAIEDISDLSDAITCRSCKGKGYLGQLPIPPYFPPPLPPANPAPRPINPYPWNPEPEPWPKPWYPTYPDTWPNRPRWDRPYVGDPPPHLQPIITCHCSR